jgi:hypothetical protein
VHEERRNMFIFGYTARSRFSVYILKYTELSEFGRMGVEFSPLGMGTTSDIALSVIEPLPASSAIEIYMQS